MRHLTVEIGGVALVAVLAKHESGYPQSRWVLGTSVEDCHNYINNRDWFSIGTEDDQEFVNLCNNWLLTNSITGNLKPNK